MASAPVAKQHGGSRGKRRLLTYTEMKPAKNVAMWYEKYSRGLFGSCVTAVREEEEEEDEHETWEKSMAPSTCRRALIRSDTGLVICSL